MVRPVLVISGGQTGADQAGLRAAKTLGIATGGWAPKHYLTEAGPAPWLRDEFGLEEHETQHDYAPRTRLNVQMADATVIFGRRSKGSNLTERICGELEKPMIWIRDYHLTPEVRRFRLWLVRVHPECLNVAGNRESVTPQIGWHVESFLVEALS